MNKKELKIYIDTIQNIYYKKIKRTKSREELKELYNYIKKIIPTFYNKEMVKEYEYILDEVLRCERLFKDDYIIESTPININQLTDYNELDLIIYEMRNYISKIILSKTKYKTEEELKNNYSFINLCTGVSDIIKRTCDRNGIKSKVIIIYPGYSKKEKIYNGYGLHAFNIVNYKNENYIVDLTYRQFFETKNNTFERVDIIGLSGCHTGYFMIEDKFRKKIAKEILTKGYIKLTEANLKAYLDGFTMSYRNGLYYDKVGNYSLENGYDIRTYGKFLRKEDNQIKHEGREVLGYQKIPSKIKKPYFN